MQLELFSEEDVTKKLEDGEETFHCKGCDTYLQSHYFSPSALALMNPDVGQRQGAGTAVLCKKCSNAYNKGLKQAHRNAPKKPISPIPCACCNKTLEPKDLHLDHDHATLKFRGWLCRNCNVGIGQLGDNIEGLEKALVYLKRHYIKEDI